VRPPIRGLARGASRIFKKTGGAVPFRVDPRLDPKPWGSRGLERFGFLLPPDTPIGEAVITSSEARVLDGPAEGTTLGTLVAADPLGLAGRRGLAATANRPLFPLLVKLIDAAQNLSIQVHPDDEAARNMDQLGKTEAWHVLSADLDAVLYLGIRAGVSVSEFIARCRLGGVTSKYLRQVPAVPGTTILIPAGTVHAIGAGVLVYEVQQPSDVTYRLDDWGRVDAAGRPRELHIDLGSAVIDAKSSPEVIPPVPVGLEGGRRLLTACRYFALEQLVLGTGEMEILKLAVQESPQVLTCLQGEVGVTARNAAVPLAMGETMVIPAACSVARVHATVPSVLLRAWVPDLVHEIVQPAHAMGVPDDEIASLAGGLSDLGSYIRKS
jgi:mannose-6-phosphate isomerase